MISDSDYLFGHGVDKSSDPLDGSLEEAIENSKGVSGLDSENKSLFSNPLSSKSKWSDMGAMAEGQFQDETQWRKKGSFVKIYDLSKESDIEEYSDVIQKSLLDDPQIILLEEDKQFSTKTDSWKVLIRAVEIEYKHKI